MGLIQRLLERSESEESDDGPSSGDVEWRDYEKTHEMDVYAVKVPGRDDWFEATDIIRNENHVVFRNEEWSDEFGGYWTPKTEVLKERIISYPEDGEIEIEPCDTRSVAVTGEQKYEYYSYDDKWSSRLKFRNLETE